MPTTTNQPPVTIRAWLTQRGVTDLPEHHVARALGIKRSEIETLLSAAPTAEALLNLNRLAQVRHMALLAQLHLVGLGKQTQRPAASCNRPDPACFWL